MAHGRRPAPRSRPGSSVYLLAFTAFLAMPASAVLAQQVEQAPLAPANQPPNSSPQSQPPASQLPAPQPDAAPPVALPSPPEAPPQKEGVFDAFGRWWDKSAADFKASVDKSQEGWRKLNEQNEKAAKDAAAAAKEAADAFSKLSSTRIVEGREMCLVAPNGSPDCQAAAEKICKAKGFTLGKSADIQTSRKCSARAWLSGNPAESACSLETVVTKAACQP